MNRTPDRREAFRLGFTPRAECRLRESNNIYTGTIRDISMVSLFLTMDDSTPLAGDCLVRIILESEHSRLLIENLEGTIIRNDEQGIAIQFKERLEWFQVVPLCYNRLAEREEQAAQRD